MFIFSRILGSLTGATSPIRSSEVERTASGIIRLKTAFRNNIKDER